MKTDLIRGICMIIHHKSGQVIHHLMESYRLVEKLGIRGGIDDSHNHIHSKEALFWAGEIIRRLPEPVPIDITTRVGHCVILHDLLDRKYPMDFSGIVQDHLGSIFDANETFDLMSVMRDMSYSKTVIADDPRPKYPAWIDKDDSWRTTFHIVREADLLSAYNIARMMAYRRSRFSEMTDEQIKEEVRALFDKRIGTMIQKDLFYFPSSRTIAGALEELSHVRMNFLTSSDISSQQKFFEMINLDHHPMEQIVKSFVATSK